METLARMFKAIGTRMKIAILIPSRNRPRMLSAVITALHEMESGKNEVHYWVGYDKDDQLTGDEILGWIPTGVEVPKEIITIGSIWNNLAQQANADIYSCMIDDAFPITPHWDKAMTSMAIQYEAFSWYEVSAPWNVGYPTCTKSWLDKIGYIVPEHFPFWFCDTWFQEMVNFVTRRPVPVSQSMSLFSKQEATQNLRDLDFWWGFFSAMRKIRLREAFAHLNCSWEEFLITRKPFIDAGKFRDAEFRGARIAELEGARGIKSEPSPKYLLAKKRAEEYLETNGLKLWGD